MSEPFRTSHQTEIQVRFNDTDALGHINNTSFALYAEYARVEFLDSLRTDDVYLILAHLSIDFVKQVKFREAVHVTTQVEKIGNSSVTLVQEVYASGEVAARVRSTVVLFDYGAQKSVRIPDEVREQLSDYTLTEA